MTTAGRTGGLCMPCSQGARYAHIDYLSLEEFFAKATGDDSLAPNLDPHPTQADFRAQLMQLSKVPGVRRCLIPVDEYEDPEGKVGPSSDRVFVSGPVEKKVIAQWAKRLKAEFYREKRPGEEIPVAYSNSEPGWFLVWD